MIIGRPQVLKTGISWLSNAHMLTTGRHRGQQQSPQRGTNGQGIKKEKEHSELSSDSSYSWQSSSKSGNSLIRDEQVRRV